MGQQRSPGEAMDANNLWLIEGLFAEYCADPQAVDASWRAYFDALGSGAASAAAPDPMSNASTRAPEPQPQLAQLIAAYRDHGHLAAVVDPLGGAPAGHPQLSLAAHGFVPADLERQYSPAALGGGPRSLRQIVAQLEQVYCRSIGAQLAHIDDLDVRTWLQQRLEQQTSVAPARAAERLRILRKLTDAETWETFVHRKFLGARRFSLEGAESLIPLLDTAIAQAAEHGVQEMIIGMAHRGRLNVMVNILGKSAQRIFEEFDDKAGRASRGPGDVKYHLGHSSDVRSSAGAPIHLSLCFNPSHLGFVGPVVAGRARAKQDLAGDTGRKHTVPLVIHGDAAFAGQGVTQEMLNMSMLPGYDCGGTVHVVVNNQVGFTTSPSMARSSHYATDVARMLDVPIFHVNGEDPEAVTRVAKLALDFRAHFGRDVVIDMVCYRRLGHNEGDEPTFTQPLMYQQIAQHRTVRELYAEALLAGGSVDAAQVTQMVEDCKARLETELARAKDGEGPPAATPKGVAVRDVWQPFVDQTTAAADAVPTAVPGATLTALSDALTRLPQGFTPHAKITRLLEGRREMGHGQKPLDWGAAETLAYASLLHEGVSIRLSGQDCGRGTFSHRHALLCDQKDGTAYFPLQHLAGAKGRFGAWDSPLSETGVVGFDYGYSLDDPEALVIWEAQYGDFANGAQVIIDQFIATSEQKWRRLSGLTMLLPHGFEGAGPEHSSARLERFLSLAADDNMQVAQPTTPAQIFHLLRRQVRQRLRRPLIVMSPKSLLRAAAAVSSLQDLCEGGFATVLGDPEQSMQKAERVVLCSGKIYYDLLAARRERAMGNVAIVRLEQLYPNPEPQLAEVLAEFNPQAPVVWAQEEPRNMGAWPHLRLTYGDRLLGRWSLSCVAREASASPATGSAAQHQREQASILQRALG